MRFHPLLERQLKRARIQLDRDDPALRSWVDLLVLVDRAYQDGDADVALTERANDLASREMLGLQAALRAERDALEHRVLERTKALFESEQRTLRLLRMSADWYWETDRKLRLTSVSIGFERITGLAEHEALGRTPREIWPDSPDAAVESGIGRAFDARQKFSDVTVSLRQPKGSLVELLISGEPHFDETGEFVGYAGVAHNVTEERRAKREIERRSMQDDLTGLGNRRRFELVARELVAARAPFVLTLIDLDKFKSVNDSNGHHAGDELLIQVGRRLLGCAAPNEDVFRLSGDEFVVVSRGETESVMALTLEKILDAIQLHEPNSALSTLPRASAGSASFPTDAADVDGLLCAADVAMYSAKQLGGGRHLRYTLLLREQWDRRATLAQAIDRALVERSMQMYYQPVFDRSGKQVLGYEALLRWDGCPMADVSPGELVEFAQQLGLTARFTSWCLQQVESDAAILKSSMKEGFVAVNFSPRQIVDELSYGSLLRLESGLRAHNLSLVVELTESSSDLSSDALAVAIRRIADAGIEVSLDDFGRGSSSLDRVISFPVKRIKLDRFLVADIDADVRRQHLLSAVLSMARSLKLRVTAEGVETAAELAALQTLGVDETQGYLLARPASVNRLVAPALESGSH